MPSSSTPLPIIKTERELAEFFQLSEFELKRFCIRTNSFYHSFERPKKSGKGMRTISAPADSLKGLQRKIKQDILDLVETHSSCMGYKKGFSIVDNAAPHVGQRFVLNLDIKDFFQSINAVRVAGYFLSLGYPEEVSVLLSRICCNKNVLPQGAPSSPSLANLICSKLDRRLYGVAKKNGLVYTRYCDDITISGGAYVKPHLQKFVESILEEEGFEVNKDKTRLLSRRSCQTVTGLTVNEKVSIPRKRRRLIRAILHRASLERAPGACNSYVSGLVGFMNMVNGRGVVTASAPATATAI